MTLLFAWQNCFLWPSTFLVSWKLLIDTFLKIVFLIFWSLLPKLSCLLLIVKSIFKHIYFCWVFIHCVLSTCKSVCCLFFNHKFSVLLRAFLKRHFLFLLLKKTFWKTCLCFLELCFHLVSFQWMKVHFCLSRNLFLVFRWNEW